MTLSDCTLSKLGKPQLALPFKLSSINFFKMAMEMVLGSCQVAHAAEIIVLALLAVVSHVFNGSGQTDVALIVSKEKLFLI